MRARERYLPKQRTTRRLGEAALAALALALAFGTVLLYAANRLGLVDWLALGHGVLRPAAALFYPSLIAKTTRLLAGVGLAYAIGVGLASWLVTRRKVRAILGEGTVVVYRRILGFAWVPVLTALYLLRYVSLDDLLVHFSLHGDSIVFSVPFLVSVVFFGGATIFLAPRPDRPLLVQPFRCLAAVAPVVVALGAVASLADIFAPSPTSFFKQVVESIVVQCTLTTVDVAFILLVAEAGVADWRAVRAVAGGGLRIVSWPALRLGLRSALFALPVLAGFWLAIGAQLPSASVFTAADGSLMTVYDPYGQPRILDKSSDVSPWMYWAIDAIEDPGAYSTPLLHAPINPIRVAGVFTAAAGSLGGSADLSGASGIAAQSCKNFVGRSFADSANEAPGSVPGRRVMAMGGTLAQKLFFEFPCGWAFERMSLLLPLDRSPVTFYLNEVYFGQGVYGVEEASYTYFGKSARDLTPGEAALLAGLPQAPSAYDPWTNPDLVRARRHLVLQAMVREHYLSASEAQQIDQGPLGVGPAPRRYPDTGRHLR